MIDKGLVISGHNEEFDLVEMIEIEDHLGFWVQFHPELKSRIVNTHPLFEDLFVQQKIIMNQNKFQNVINKIKLLVSDVDGVLTDGKIYFIKFRR